MQDLTKINTPFGLLDEVTQTALREHGGPYQYYINTGWSAVPKPAFLLGYVYRVKPQEQTKPSIDWSHVTPDYEWLARDEDGECYLYVEKPEAGRRDWFNDLAILNAKGFVSFVPGTCDWADSLVQRPGTE